jgi:hypothetical protein
VRDIRCLHCGEPILDDECYQVGLAGSSSWIHIECHAGFKASKSKEKINRIYTKCYNRIYESKYAKAEQAIQEKWRSFDRRKYNGKRVKAIKKNFDMKGPSNGLLNEIERDFIGHPNGIRILIRTIFLHPAYKANAFRMLQKVKDNPLIFDLFMLESIEILLNGEELKANMLFKTMFDLEQDKTFALIDELLNSNMLLPSNLYRNSVIRRILEHYDSKKALTMCLIFPSNLIWSSGIVLERFTDDELRQMLPTIELLIQKYDDNPIMWSELARTLFRRGCIRNSPEMVFMIRQSTIKLIQSNKYQQEMAAKPSEDWEDLLVALIEGIGFSQYDLLEQIQQLKMGVSELNLWTDKCTDALFRVIDPTMHDTLSESNTFFDELDFI